MSEYTTNLALPFLASGQAQKHVTVNETLTRLDALVQLSVVSATLAAEPASPADGARYILPAGKTGAAWGAMSAGAIAYYRDGAWEALTPRAGFLAWVEDEARVLIHTGAAWTERAPLIEHGTFTPTVTFATPGDLSVSYANQTGFYERVGRLCFIDMSVVFTPVFSTAAGRLELPGLPFPAKDTVSTLNVRNLTSVFVWPTGRTQVNAMLTAVNEARFRIAAVGSGVSLLEFGAANLVSGAAHTIGCSGAYRV